MLDLYNNQLISLPTEIGSLTALKTLHLRSNQLISLPTEIGSLTALTTLDLSNNQLISLPTEIVQLQNLCQVTLIGCPLSVTFRGNIQGKMSAVGYQGPQIFYTKPTRAEVEEDVRMKSLSLLAGTESRSLKL